MMRACVLICAVVLFLPCAALHAAEPGPVGPELASRLRPYLVDVCDWIMTLDLGSGRLKNTQDTSWLIYINGNLARSLMAGHKITGNPAYLAEAVRWCDWLVAQQQPVVTSQGEEAGYWCDAGADGCIYLADAGTASTALAVISRHVDAQRQTRYRETLERYATFVRDGCREDPQGKARGGSRGWVIRSGKDRGALGCGYYEGHLSEAPYIIAAAVNGGAFHSILYSMNKDPRLAEISSGAVRWILAQRQPNGELPYLIDGQPPASHHWPYNTMTYCGEGFIAAHTYLDDPALRTHIATEVKPCIQWLLTTQNADGSWGKLALGDSADAQRSPGVATLLAWYYRTVDPDPRIADAVQKYAEYLLRPENSKRYGVKSQVRGTGFVALVVADLIEPGATRY